MSTIGERLAQYLGQAQDGAFDWARNNCCHFAARWVQRETGADPLAGLPETPDALAAVRLLRVLGGMRAFWSGALRHEPLPPKRARTGDVVLVNVGELPQQCIDAPVGTGAAVGICSGRNVVLMDAAGAALFLPMEHAACAWHLH